MTTKMVVEGDETLAATSHIAARRLSDASRPSSTVAAYIGTRGRSSAPVRTGRLAASVRYAGNDDGAEIGSGLVYANRTHWGYARYRQAPQPFIAEQVWNNTARITDEYRKWTDDIVGGIMGAV